MDFPKQTDCMDEQDKGYVPGLAKAIRGFGCHFCCLIKIVSKFLGIDMTISTENLMDIAYHGILAGKIQNNNIPTTQKDWYRMFIPDTVEFCKWLASYWDQKINISLLKYGSSELPLKINTYKNIPEGANFCELEYKDEKYQHFVTAANPETGKLIQIDYNPDPSLKLLYLISIRYISISRA